MDHDPDLHDPSAPHVVSMVYICYCFMFVIAYVLYLLWSVKGLQMLMSCVATLWYKASNGYVLTVHGPFLNKDHNYNIFIFKCRIGSRRLCHVTPNFLVEHVWLHAQACAIVHSLRVTRIM